MTQKIFRVGFFILLLQLLGIAYSDELKDSEVLVSVMCDDVDSGWVYVALHNTETGLLAFPED